jgi:ectoine hydroxylase-related dioxygenase (phytanoyl-CoA dioxygenase family)
MQIADDLTITSITHALDTSEQAFGELRNSSCLVGDGEGLRERLQEDGYLFIRGFHKRDDVMAARRVMVERLAQEGLLEPGTEPMDAIIKKGGDSAFRPDLTTDNAPLMDVLYGRNMMSFYDEIFSEPALHYDFTWLRAMGPGKGSQPHCDIVYMGRGERQRLMTAWCPLGDVSLRLGGLMVLEGSNHHHDKLRNYLERDVDTYCSNGRHAAEIEAGTKSWEWNGVLSKDPHSLQKKLGGRWLTTEFEAGDLLTFTMYTVHASLDNQSGDRIRFSSDTRYQPASSPADERWIGANPIAHGQAGKRDRVC